MTVVNGYTKRAVIKRRLGNIPSSDTIDDAAIDDAIAAVSRDIDYACSQHFYLVEEARFFEARWTNKLRFGDFNTLAAATYGEPPGPIEVATDDADDGTFVAWDPSEFQLLCKDDTPNQNSGPETRPFTSLVTIGRNLPVSAPGTTQRRFRVRITGPWGWLALPRDVIEAANILATETFKLKDAPFGAAGLADLGIVRVRDNSAAQKKLREYIPPVVA